MPVVFFHKPVQEALSDFLNGPLHLRLVYVVPASEFGRGISLAMMEVEYFPFLLRQEPIVPLDIEV